MNMSDTQENQKQQSRNDANSSYMTFQRNSRNDNGDLPMDKIKSNLCSFFHQKLFLQKQIDRARTNFRRDIGEDFPDVIKSIYNELLKDSNEHDFVEAMINLCEDK